MTRSKRLEDCPILVPECLAGREVILMTIQKDIQRIIIQNDSQLVVNSIYEEIGVSKVIINLVVDAK